MKDLYSFYDNIYSIGLSIGESLSNTFQLLLPEGNPIKNSS